MGYMADRPVLRQIQISGNLVTLWPEEGDNDYVVRIPMAHIAYWEVDWPVNGGKITVHTAYQAFSVVFLPGDQGEGCADALSALEEAFNR